MELTEKSFPEWEGKEVWLYDTENNTVEKGNLYQYLSNKWRVEGFHYTSRGTFHQNYYVYENTRIFTESYEAYARQLPHLIDKLRELNEQSINIVHQKEKISEMKKHAEYVIGEYFRKK